MSSPAPSRDLARLATLHGVATHYRDAYDQLVRIPTERLVAVLALLGVELSSESGAAGAVRDERARRRAQVLEPVQVHRGEGPAVLSFAARPKLQRSGSELRIETEGGARHSFSLNALPYLESKRGYRRVRLPEELPFGYHRVSLHGGDLEAQTTLLVAPSTLPQAPRSWGLFLPLYALRAGNDLGVGTFSGLGEMKEFVAARGGEWLATLPLYSLYLEEPIETSPYLPVSRLAWNELFLDLERLVSQSHDEEAARLFGELASSARAAVARDPRRVHYEGAVAARRPLLQRLAEVTMQRVESARLIAEFFGARRELAAYCEFRAGAERAAGLGARRPPAADPLALQYHRYVQFAAVGQLEEAQGRGAGLLLDLPVGVHPRGFDASYFASSFANGASVGAPPDLYYSKGQDWSCPPLDPARQREDGYRYLRACLRTGFAHARGLRIDHVMGLERLWWIPKGADATAGAYVHYRLEELRAVLAIEANRAGAAIVGEDLGTVSDAIERAMDDDGMLHCSVVQFQLRPTGPLPQPAASSIASLGTHDLPKFAAYWKAADIVERATRETLPEELLHVELAARRAIRAHVAAALEIAPSRCRGEVEPSLSSGEELPPSRLARGVQIAPEAARGDPLCSDEVTRAALVGLLGHLAKSAAAITMVDLEDCWLEEEPTNRPGTASSVGNWRRRAARTLEEIERDTELRQLLQGLDSCRKAMAEEES